MEKKMDTNIKEFLKPSEVAKVLTIHNCVL